MNSCRRRDVVAAILFLIFGLVTVFYLIPQGVSVPGSVKVAALSPDFWPRLIAYGTITASVFLLIETMTLQPPHNDKDEADDAAEFQYGVLSSTLRIIVLIFALFAFYASLTTLGIVAASIILLISMMLFFGERNLWLLIPLSAGVPILLYLFFRYVASIPIPVGIFG